MRRIALHTLAAAAMCGLATPAFAETWLYAYAGNDLTDVTSACCGADTPFTTSDAFRFQFTSPSLLAPNLTDAGFSAPIDSWSLSVGPLHYASGAPGNVLYSINFSTDAAGKITGYQFTTQTDVVAPDLLPAEYPPTPYEEEVFSFDLPAEGFGVEDGIYIPSIFQDSTYASNSGSPGTWTITAVPEPLTWVVMLAGLFGVGAALRAARRPCPATLQPS
jgi:hypothetical protein